MFLAVHYQVMEHLGSLESTQEARVALGYASGNSYTSFVLSKLPAYSITRWCTLKHEPIVNCKDVLDVCSSQVIDLSSLRVDNLTFLGGGIILKKKILQA